MNKFLTSDRIGGNFSGDDDDKELRDNGKGLIVNDSGDDWERPSWTSKRYFCTNCRKGIHNTPDNDNRCRRKGCECRCLTHYVGRDGVPRLYETPDDSFVNDDTPKFSPESDDLIADINKQWHESHGTLPKKWQEKERAI